jgi:hypothetical protein
MNNIFYIKSELKDTLKNLGCSSSCETVSVYKKEQGKVFFSAGNCKLHLTEEEFNASIVETTPTSTDIIDS